MPVSTASHASPWLAPLLAAASMLLASGTAEARRRPPRPHADATRSRASETHAAELITVEEIGARSGAATLAMRARVREHVAHQLHVLAEGRLLTAARGYVVDGSIDGLDVVARPDGLEISCAVRLILSARRSGAMVAMTTGTATLKQPAGRGARRALKPGQEERLELEVLDGAVRAASDELIQHFEARRKS